MNVLILGSGGREHALAWKIAQSEMLTQLYIAPGNAGTASVGTNVDIAVTDFGKIAEFVTDKHIDLIIVGPEDPLVLGIKDYFKSRTEFSKLKILGPDKQAAQLEGSKAFAKAFMEKYSIPTAAYKSFTRDQIDEAYRFMEKLKAPYVLKADGLAAGKGVIIEKDIRVAKEALRSLLDGQFGAASEKVVIEEFLDGIELSVFVLTDGLDYVILPEAKDYKRIGEGDTGLNTGGMGAVSPVSFANENFMNKVRKFIIEPTIEGINAEGFDYSGFVFFGLINVKGLPYVIEYNVRMGDPETEVVVPRIESDLLELLDAATENDLIGRKLQINSDFATTVMLVSQGYPEAYEKGKEISNFELTKDSLVFHAGTKLSKNKVLTNGGRVMAVTSYGSTMDAALKQSYKVATEIQFDGKNYRSDIGFDL